jgi:hypothetical protein
MTWAAYVLVFITAAVVSATIPVSTVVLGRLALDLWEDCDRERVTRLLRTARSLTLSLVPSTPQEVRT